SGSERCGSTRTRNSPRTSNFIEGSVTRWIVRSCSWVGPRVHMSKPVGQSPQIRRWVSGASEFSNLLATLEPELSASEIVFCHFPGVSFEDKPPFRSLGAFDEREGLTLIVSRSEAEMNGLPFETALRVITLNVRSSLDVVGLTAAVAGSLD